MASKCHCLTGSPSLPNSNEIIAARHSPPKLCIWQNFSDFRQFDTVCTSTSIIKKKSVDTSTKTTGSELPPYQMKFSVCCSGNQQKHFTQVTGRSDLVILQSAVALCLKLSCGQGEKFKACMKRFFFRAELDTIPSLTNVRVLRRLDIWDLQIDELIFFNSSTGTSPKYWKPSLRENQNPVMVNKITLRSLLDCAFLLFEALKLLRHLVVYEHEGENKCWGNLCLRFPCLSKKCTRKKLPFSSQELSAQN